MDMFICCNVRKQQNAPDISEMGTAPRNGINPGTPGASNRSKLAGVGIVFHGIPGEGLVVEALTQGGPAEASDNVRTGDVLESIDGSPVAKMTDRELAKNLLGPPGSKVVLGMIRSKSNRIMVELERQWPKPK